MANVNVTYEEMQSASKRLNNGRDEITAKLEELQKLVQSLVNGGYVTDKSSRQFEGAYEKFTLSAKGTIASLQDMGVYLQTAADVFRNADEQLSSKLNG